MKTKHLTYSRQKFLYFETKLLMRANWNTVSCIFFTTWKHVTRIRMSQICSFKCFFPNARQHIRSCIQSSFIIREAGKIRTWTMRPKFNWKLICKNKSLEDIFAKKGCQFVEWFDMFPNASFFCYAKICKKNWRQHKQRRKWWKKRSKRGVLKF